MTISKQILSKFSGYPAFSYRDVYTYFNIAPSKRANLTRILSHLKSSGKIFTVAKGIYTTHRNDVVCGFAFKPFYYGLLYALTIRELWSQNARPDIITLRNVRSSEISIFNDKKDVVSIHHSPVKYFFGFDILDYSGLKVSVSDPEKTLIDLFYYKTRLPIQEYSGLLKAVNRNKIEDYLKNYDKHTIATVNNFLNRYKTKADKGKLENQY